MDSRYSLRYWASDLNWARRENSLGGGKVRPSCWTDSMCEEVLFAAITIQRFVKVFYEAGPGRQYLNPRRRYTTISAFRPPGRLALYTAHIPLPLAHAI